MNKLIWTYWHQGLENAPPIVRRCVGQMKSVHPDWTIRVLDEGSVYEFAEPVPVKPEIWGELSLPHQSDLLRTQLLIKYGGVWMDPTVFCVQSLDNWIFQAVEKAGVFFFDKPGPDRIISNWFIASEPDNELLTKLYRALIEYWNINSFRNLGQKKAGRVEAFAKRLINGRSLGLSQIWLSPLFTKVLRLYPYMIYHFMFYRLIRTDEQFRSIWEQMTKVSADGPHSLQEIGLRRPMDDALKQKVDTQKEMLFKLNWKLPAQSLEENNLISYLFAKYS